MSLQITQSSAGGTPPSVTSIAGVPATVPIPAGNCIQPAMKISIFGNPGANTTLTFELAATIAPEGASSTYAATTFRVTGVAPPPAVIH